MHRDPATHRLHRFFNPRSIALVGASPDTSIIRGRIVAAVVGGGYEGAVYPISRSHETIQGLTSYRDIESLPEVPDLAIITVPAPVVPGLLESCARAGVRGAVIISSGFNEQGDDDARLREAQVARIAGQYSMVVCGPNAEGFYNATGSLTATFSPALHDKMPVLNSFVNAVAIVSQSGGVGFAIHDRGRSKGLQTSYVVSMGNETDLEALEVVDYLIDDASTGVVALFLEGFKSPARFSGVARRAALCAKPLVVAKVGRSAAGARASLSHTATLAGSHAVYESVLRHEGCTLVDDVEALVDLSHAFSQFKGRRANGKRVAILTASGGAGIWAADVCESSGLEVVALDVETRHALSDLMPAYGSAANPVDITAQGVYSFGFSTPLEILLSTAEVDMVMVVCSTIRPDTMLRDAESLIQTARTHCKPIMFCSYTTVHPDVVQWLNEGSIPITNSMPNAARALRAWADYCEFLEIAAPEPVRPARSRAQSVVELLDASPDILCEHRARLVLDAAGIALRDAWLASSAEQAVAAFGRSGGAVALKIQSPDIVHKSDVGALLLGLEDEAAVEAGYHEMLAAAGRACPQARIDGVLVQPMAAPGVEIIIGIKHDKDFGPVLLLGLGGIWVELLDDVQLAAAPVSRLRASDMVRRLEGSSLLKGRRGRPAADVEALVGLASSISAFADTYRDQVAELDLNPVIVHPQGQGFTVVDAVIIKQQSIHDD